MDQDVIAILINIKLIDSYVPSDNWELFLDDLSEHPRYNLMEIVDNSGVFLQYSALFNVEDRTHSLNYTFGELRKWIDPIFDKWSIPIP